MRYNPSLLQPVQGQRSPGELPRASLRWQVLGASPEARISGCPGQALLRDWISSLAMRLGEKTADRAIPRLRMRPRNPRQASRVGFSG
jgi:hypothetical protein